MTYQRSTDAPPRWQFETSSGTLTASQVYNCGLASIACIVGYMQDRWTGVEAGRKLIRGMGPYSVNGEIVYGCPPSMPTTAWQQRDILRTRGVPSEVYGVPGVAELRGLVFGGRRPVLLGLNYARVADQIAGHSFDGWHAVVVLTWTEIDGVPGFLVMDPNFSPPGGIRPDPLRGRRFYPESSMRNALADPELNWAVVPISPKQVAVPIPPPPAQITEAQEMAIEANVEVVAPRWFDVPKNTRLRKGPGLGYPHHFLTTVAEKFYLAGLVGGWAKASRGPGTTGFFWVPPPNLRGTGK